MATLYSEEIKKVLNSFIYPRGLIVDVVEYEEHLALRLYRNNFEKFDGVDKEYIAKTVGAAIKAVRDLGCPCYMEVEKNVPK